MSDRPNWLLTTLADSLIAVLEAIMNGAPRPGDALEALVQARILLANSAKILTLDQSVALKLKANEVHDKLLDMMGEWDKKNWSETPPEQSGLYWCYGTARPHTTIGVRPIWVEIMGDRRLYQYGASAVHPQGLWLPVIMPDMPEETTDAAS